MVTFRYRGREIHPEEILYIRELIEQHPTDSRRKLSTRLCEAWDWRQNNGALRDMVCRGLLLMLERAGEITLPRSPTNGTIRWRSVRDRRRCWWTRARWKPN